MSQIAVGYIFTVACAVLVILGDTLIKLTADQNRSLLTLSGVGGLSFYLASGIFWYWAVQRISLGHAGVAFAMFTMLALCVIGATVFGEAVALRDLLGIAFAIAALVLLMRWA